MAVYGLLSTRTATGRFVCRQTAVKETGGARREVGVGRSKVDLAGCSA